MQAQPPGHSEDTQAIERLLAFWFGHETGSSAVAAEKAALWWKKDPAVDAQCRRLFLPLVEAAGAGALDGWTATARGRLALILLTDQLPRNIFRDSARAHDFDATALQYCLDGLDVRADRALRPIERVFFYLPLEHAESASLQERSVALFTELAQAAAPGERKLFDDYLAYAIRHRDIVARFGRFPHRNALLGRPSTAAESAFLATPGSRF